MNGNRGAGGSENFECKYLKQLALLFPRLFIQAFKQPFVLSSVVEVHSSWQATYNPPNNNTRTNDKARMNLRVFQKSCSIWADSEYTSTGTKCVHGGFW